MAWAKVGPLMVWAACIASWQLLGYADQALALVEQTITEGVALDHTLTLANTLSHAACFIALWAGDLALAARYTKM
jgi:hypothetical protein